MPDERLSQHFADAGSADGYGFLHFLRRNDEGGIEIQDVAQGAKQKSLFKGFPVNPVPQPLLGRKAFFGFPVLHQFNGVHQAQAAYFPHVGMIPQGFHDHLAEKRGLFLRPGNNVLLVQDLQHGEGGGVRVPMKSSKETVATVAEALCRNLELKAGDRAFVMINGCGATTMMEMLVLFKDTVEFLKERGVEVAASMVGEILTVQEAGGFQMNIAKWDDEFIRLWNTPCHTPAYSKE